MIPHAHVIERDAPPPAYYSQARWPLASLGIGDQFFVSESEKPVRRTQYLVYSYGRRHGKRFTVRKVRRGGEIGAVVRRTA